MGRFKDLTGRRFGLLTVVSLADHRAKDGKIQWNCVCDCGNSATIRSASLIGGINVGCGCRNGVRANIKVKESQLKTVHGIILKERDFIFNYQGNCCAICQTDEPKSKMGWQIDHCPRKRRHIGKRRSIRGILCYPCNNALVRGYEHLLFQRADQPFPLVDGYLMNPPAQAALKLYDSLNNEINMEAKQDDDDDNQQRSSDKPFKLVA
jgi:recombination endonuclease VII